QRPASGLRRAGRAEEQVHTLHTGRVRLAGEGRGAARSVRGRRQEGRHGQVLPAFQVTRRPRARRHRQSGRHHAAEEVHRALRSKPGESEDLQESRGEAQVSETFDVAIIGAGASGTLTAVQFARFAGPHARGALIDAGARAARGLAYGTPYGAHLLNVPAARMSALPDDPDHFLRWLRGRDANASPGTFAPRALYGDYLASLL